MSALAVEKGDKQTKKRFGDISNDGIEELLQAKVSKKTVQSTELAARVFQSFCSEKGVDMNSADMTDDNLANLLVTLYANIKNQNGENYRSQLH